MAKSDIRITNFKLGVGIPTNFPMVWTEFFYSFAKMHKPAGYILLEPLDKHERIDEIRNGLCRLARAAGCSHLFMCDVDMVYHPNTLRGLLALDRDIAVGLAHRRYPPFDPLAMRGEPNTYEYVPLDEAYGDAPYQVDNTGSGCMLVKLRTLEAIAEPWFEFGDNPDPNVGGKMGEDITFYWKARKAGLDIWIDPRVEAEHLTLFRVGRDTHRLYAKMKQAQAEFEKEKQAADGKAEEQSKP